MNLLKLVPAVALLGLVGCSNIHDKFKENTEYKGAWETSCSELNESSFGNLDKNYEIYEGQVYQKHVVDIKKDKLTHISLLSGTEDCSDYLSGYTSVHKIEKSLKNENSLYNIDLSLNSLTKAFHDDQMVIAANNSKLYGFSDWEKSIPKDISSLKEFPDSKSEPKKDTKNFDIIKVEKDGLRFGKSNSKTKRPSELGELVYKKVTK